jgi:prepilin-type N-terminal cleavage/methylation domain-containing protein
MQLTVPTKNLVRTLRGFTLIELIVATAILVILTTLAIPLEEIGISAGETYELHELLTDGRRLAHESALAVELDPRTSPAHIYRVSRWRRREQDFPYFR